MEGKAADGTHSLPHESIIVLDIVDQLTIPIVDCGELIHRATAKKQREHSTLVTLHHSEKKVFYFLQISHEMGIIHWAEAKAPSELT